jgi:hypothetical protein
MHGDNRGVLSKIIAGQYEETVLKRTQRIGSPDERMSDSEPCSRADHMPVAKVCRVIPERHIAVCIADQLELRRVRQPQSCPRAVFAKQGTQRFDE